MFVVKFIIPLYLYCFIHVYIQIAFGIKDVILYTFVIQLFFIIKLGIENLANSWLGSIHVWGLLVS
jgi:hypothetical protein